MNQTKTYCGNCQYYFNGQCSSPYPCYCGQPVEVNPRNYLKIVASKRTEEQIRKEAVKEFAEKLKEICVSKRRFIDIDDKEEYYFDGAVTINEIDELLKEYGVEVEE